MCWWGSQAGLGAILVNGVGEREGDMSVRMVATLVRVSCLPADGLSSNSLEERGDAFCFIAKRVPRLSKRLVFLNGSPDFGRYNGGGVPVRLVQGGRQNRLANALWSCLRANRSRQGFFIQGGGHALATHQHNVSLL